MITTFGLLGAADTACGDAETMMEGPSKSTRLSPRRRTFGFIPRILRSRPLGKIQPRWRGPAQVSQPMTVARQLGGRGDVVQFARVLVQVVELLLPVRIIDVGV